MTPFLHAGVWGWTLRINPLGLWLLNQDRLEDDAAIHAEHCDCDDEHEGGSVGLSENDLTQLFQRLYDREIEPGPAFAEFLVGVRGDPDGRDEP